MPTYDASTLMAASSGMIATGKVKYAAHLIAAAVSGMTPGAAVSRSAFAIMAASSSMEAHAEKNHQYDGACVMAAESTIFYGGGRTKNASVVMAAESDMVTSICSSAYGLQVIDGIDAVFSVWGTTCRDTGCGSAAGEEAVNCLNAAFQRLHASGKYHQFISRVTRTEELTALNDAAFSYGFGVWPDVQSVCAPVFLRYATPETVVPGNPSRTVLALTGLTFASVNFAGVTGALTGVGGNVSDTVASLLAAMNGNSQWAALYSAQAADVGASTWTITITTLVNGPPPGPGSVIVTGVAGGVVVVGGIQTTGSIDVVTPEMETSRRTLRPLPSLAAFQSFNQSYFENGLNIHQEPLAYFVEQNADASIGTLIHGGPALPNQIVIHLAPRDPITSSVKDVAPLCYLQYDAILKPVRFACQQPATRLPVPHLYAETVLLPLAKYYACSSRFFQGKSELREAIFQQAREVLAVLGDIDPRPVESKEKGTA